MNDIWQPITVGHMQLSHRLAMAPMTRSRAQPSTARPGDLAAEYYAQRASVGLIISEGTQPSDDGQGYLATPGHLTPTPMSNGWRQVMSAVHGKGGRIFIQLMHVGRIAHPDNTPHHRQAVAPSAIAPDVPMFTPTGHAGQSRAARAEDRGGPPDRRRFPSWRPSARWRLAPTESRFMARTDTWSSSSLPPTPTPEPTSMAGRLRTGPALPSRWPLPSPRRSARREPQSGCRPGRPCGGIDEGAGGSGAVPSPGRRTRQVGPRLSAHHAPRERAASGRDPTALEPGADRQPAEPVARADRQRRGRGPGRHGVLRAVDPVQSGLRRTAQGAARR